MKYTIHIDQSKCVQWGLNFSEGALVDFLSTLSTWAEPVMIGGELYFFASRNKVLDELPMLTDKPDTVYRLYKSLCEKGVIDYMKQGRKDLVRLTAKGKKWNSEKNPSLSQNSENFPTKLGKKSENNSENFPTDNNTIIDNNTIDKEKRARFQPPTKEEVYSYMLEKSESEIIARREAEKFHNYYESNGWKVGRNKMKSWTHAAGGWLNRAGDFSKTNTNAKDEPRFGAATHAEIERALEIRRARRRAV